MLLIGTRREALDLHWTMVHTPLNAVAIYILELGQVLVVSQRYHSHVRIVPTSMTKCIDASDHLLVELSTCLPKPL